MTHLSETPAEDSRRDDDAPEAPYARLTPDTLLDALDAHGWRGDGRLLALNSYENRVYQVWLEDGGAVVAKFYRPGRWTDAQILEEHAFTAELADREIPVVAPLVRDASTLHEHAGYRFAVYPLRGGRTPELDDPDVLKWIGRFLGRIHAVGSTRTFDTRPNVDPVTLGDEPRNFLARSGMIPGELRAAWLAIVDPALELAREAFASAAPLHLIRLHGDCHSGNILWTDAGPHFVDFDDARNGPAIQDLWMLLSGDAAAMSAQLASLLEGYRQFADVDPREFALVEALRTLRLIHYGAWIARRWDDPAFPAAFPWFGTVRYWQDRILELREQVAAMREPGLALPY